MVIAVTTKTPTPTSRRDGRSFSRDGAGSVQQQPSGDAQAAARHLTHPAAVLETIEPFAASRSMAAADRRPVRQYTMTGWSWY
jgi:hypothetical protein